MAIEREQVAIGPQIPDDQFTFPSAKNDLIAVERIEVDAKQLASPVKRLAIDAPRGIDVVPFPITQIGLSVFGTKFTE